MKPAGNGSSLASGSQHTSACKLHSSFDAYLITFSCCCSEYCACSSHDAHDMSGYWMHCLLLVIPKLLSSAAR
jgi:hypothetical protein